MVRAYNSNNSCLVSDNGPAGANINTGVVTGGFTLLQDAGYNAAYPSSTFITPPGYKPMGPVSIWCTGATYVAARGW
jgi:hypothetical protein